MPNYAIIGFGNAGYHAMKAIRARDPHGVIDVYSASNAPPANPMLTTYYVRGDLSYCNIFPHGSIADLIATYRICFHPNSNVVQVDPVQKTLRLERGSIRRYDRLLLATGASAFVPPAEGMQLPQVLAMRTPEDAQQLRVLLETGKVHSLLVVGASMVGIKLVELAQLRGISCTLADGAPYMFPLAAFSSTAERIQSFLSGKGVNLAFSAFLDKITASANGLTAVMKDGKNFCADVIAVCIGTRANLAPTLNTGIATARGILVDKGMRTNIPDVFAAGDCAQGFELQSGQQRQIGLWANAAYQGRTAGQNMAGGAAAFDFTILSNISHFLGMDFIGMGDAATAAPEDTSYEFQSDTFYLKANKGTDGKVKCINMLGGGAISGIIKNRFMKIMQGTPDIEDSLMQCILQDAGIPLSFINFLGGTHDGN